MLITLSHLHPLSVRNDSNDRLDGVAKSCSQWVYVFPTHFKSIASAPFDNDVKLKKVVGWSESRMDKHMEEETLPKIRGGRTDS